jgi:4-amino-4-deoxy-L-arabinose transferase-like glycosyltransferase
MDFQKKINENYQIILILIISLIIFSTFSLTSKVKYWDETVYANLGYDLSRNISGYSFENTGYSDFVPCGESSQYCWPNAGFRPPLLPFVFSILYITNLSFLIPFFIPVISTLNLLLVYLLGRRLFSKSTGIYAAIITSLVPIYYFFSGKMLNDILISFFITLSALFFWLGYEQNKSKYKILLGLTLALGLLAKYTMLWFFPALLIYLIFRKKLIKTLLDKSFWLSIVVFFLILIPWMFYSFITYRNPIGSIIHGLKAASYWGGFSSWNFFFSQ